MAYGTTSTLEQTASVNNLIPNPGGSILIHAVLLNPGTTASSVSLFPAATATGTAILKVVGAANDSIAHVALNNPVCCNGPISTTLAGTSATYTIVYSRT